MTREQRRIHQQIVDADIALAVARQARQTEHAQRLEARIAELRAHLDRLTVTREAA